MPHDACIRQHALRAERILVVIQQILIDLQLYVRRHRCVLGSYRGHRPNLICNWRHTLSNYRRALLLNGYRRRIRIL